jgi:hypothetical protein
MANDPPSYATSATVFQELIAHLANADALADRLGYVDPALRPAFHQHVMMLVALAYVEVFGTRIETPDWVPHIPFYLPWGSPNPDDIYRFVPIDPRGSYRLSGRKGTAPVGLITMRKGGAHLGEINGRTLAEIDLTAVVADASGRFDFVLSAERPAGYAGPWYALHPETASLLYRSRTDDESQSDAVCHIHRQDVAAPPTWPAPEEVARKMAMLTRYAARQAEFLLAYLNGVRARGGDRGFIFDDQSGYGSVIHQRVLMHVFSLDQDEALILESEIPEQVRYWSVQVFDAHFTAVDYVFHQSSLNGAQARLDADGRVRIVVSARDPQVPNWLDTAGWPSAGLLWRWTYASAFPQPRVTRVRHADLPRLLPAGTARIEPAARREALQARASYYQTRGR